MAYTWEPRWESYRIEYHGVIIHTCRDRVTKIIACPICINALNRCISSGSNFDVKRETENIFFQTEEDLIIHIREYHAMKLLMKTLTSEREE